MATSPAHRPGDPHLSNNDESEFDALAELQSTERAKLLNVIDELRELGLEEVGIELPQIVVVGNQSSGKSSVLEAISNFAFPTNDVRCTQFPTEIRMRKSMTFSNKVSIQPHKNSTSEEVKRLRDWSKVDISLDDLPKYMQEAAQVMAIDSNKSNFSRHVLKIDREGPECINLTLIDLPGLIQVTESVQTEGDKLLVEGMVKSYMSNHQAIILAVIGADSDLSGNGVLDLLRKIDPSGTRSMGHYHKAG